MKCLGERCNVVESRENHCHPTSGFQKSKPLGEKKDSSGGRHKWFGRNISSESNAYNHSFAHAPKCNFLNKREKIQKEWNYTAKKIATGGFHKALSISLHDAVPVGEVSVFSRGNLPAEKCAWWEVLSWSKGIAPELILWGSFSLRVEEGAVEMEGVKHPGINVIHLCIQLCFALTDRRQRQTGWRMHRRMLHTDGSPVEQIALPLGQRLSSTAQPMLGVTFQWMI